MKLRYLVVIFLPTLLGCAHNVSPNSYSVGSVGQVNRTIAATVISYRLIDIAGTTGTGGATGSALGAVGGSSLGGNNLRGNVGGAIVGAVVGGIAGAAIEANTTRQKGIEYVVETENGN